MDTVLFHCVPAAQQSCVFATHDSHWTPFHFSEARQVSAWASARPSRNVGDEPETDASAGDASSREAYGKATSSRGVAATATWNDTSAAKSAATSPSLDPPLGDILLGRAVIGPADERRPHAPTRPASAKGTGASVARRLPRVPQQPPRRRGTSSGAARGREWSRGGGPGGQKGEALQLTNAIFEFPMDSERPAGEALGSVRIFLVEPLRLPNRVPELVQQMPSLRLRGEHA